MDLKKEFDRQLREFFDDDDYKDAYKTFNPRGDKILIKLFKFKVDSPTDALGKNMIYVPSKINKGEWIPSNVVNTEKIYPIAKVLKKGDRLDREVEVGKLYIVPYTDVIGTSWNPEFMQLVNTFARQGAQGKGALVNVPDDMEQRIPNLEVRWDRYKFSMPDKIGNESDEDRLVYLVDSLKIIADYEPFE